MRIFVSIMLWTSTSFCWCIEQLIGCALIFGQLMLCPVGYNDFNNLVMQTLWWLPNKILRHIHKKDIPFFEPFPAKFHADFESVDKNLKKWTQKKLLAKMWRKYALFSLLLMFVKLVLLVTFFGSFFTTFSTDSKSAWNTAFFDIFFDIKKFLGHISTFCKL